MATGKLSFIRAAKQWYFQPPHQVGEDDIMLGSYHEDGGCDWELSVRRVVCPGLDTIKVGIFAGAALAAVARPAVADSLAALADCNTLDEAEAALLAAGLPGRVLHKDQRLVLYYEGGLEIEARAAKKSLDKG